LLGKKDLGTAQMPPVETALVDGELAWRMHRGGHTTAPNIETFVAWAARYLKAPGTKSRHGAQARGASVSGPAKLGSSCDQPIPRMDRNSQVAHRQLLEKARKGHIDVYFEGDSITRRWGALDYPEFLANWNKNFHGWNAANFGWGGDTIQNILWRLQHGELDQVNPKIIVLLAGTNNLGTTDPTANEEARAKCISRGIETILKVCQQKAPGAMIILMGITPRNDNLAVKPTIDKINARLARLADGKRVRYLNINNKLADTNGVLRPGMSTDRLHLSRKGYQVWADALKPIFTEILGTPASVDLAPPPTADPSAANKS